MTGGYLMSGARLALLAATGALLVGGASAQAADLGGNCCADLEERVAELEATTARKGNRKVSLKVYGQVNEAIGWWDDGNETNTYVFTNDHSRTRIGFKGKAKITSDLYAKFKIEIGLRQPDQGDLSANNDDGDGDERDLRHSYWELGSKTYGSVRVGNTSWANDGITQMTVAKTGHFSSQDIFDAVDDFAVVGADANDDWLDLAQVLEPGEGSRGNVLLYKSPTIAGFVASASWGEDDVWAVALRYAGKLGPFKIKAGIGYDEITDGAEECVSIAAGGGTRSKCRDLGMSASAMHKPTGIFVTGSYGKRWDEVRGEVLAARGFAADEELTHWHIQAGIQQKWIPLGPTTIFGGYHERDSGHSTSGSGGAQTIGGVEIGDVEIEMFEVGVNQHLSAAAMDLYIHYKQYDADVTLVDGTKPALEEFQTVITGARIKF